MPAPRIAAFLCVATLVAACHGGTVAPTASPATTALTLVSSAPAPPASSRPSPSTTAPSGLPSALGADLPAGDVPVTELVPAGTEPTGSWFANTNAGDAIAVAWEVPGPDPFRADRGFVVWRHTGDPVLWRPVFAVTYPAARHPVLGITATVDDVTGDGSDDVLVFAETGGSGGCGTYLVVDAASGAQAFRRSVCDASIEPSVDPAGLILTEAVYAHGDPHCCPSATRTTVLRAEADGAWTTVSVTTAPT
jgi:hypothetical protein